jgi:lipopolysaccharide export system permease protein
MRIFRYFCKEVLTTSITIWGIMLLIMLMSQSAAYLGMIARGTVALSYLGKLLLLNIPFLSTYILPFAFYFGVLLTYGRLYADSEMVVLQASGFSTRRLFAYTLAPALLVLLITAYLVLHLNPEIISKKGKILQFSSSNVLQSLVPGEFRSIDDGNTIIYVSKANHNKTQLHDVFVAHLSKKSAMPIGDEWTVSYMHNAHKERHFAHDYLQTGVGAQYKGVPGEAGYSILHYKSFANLLPGSAITQEYKRLDGTPTTLLMAMRNNLHAQAELQWRYSCVIQVLILTLLAIPLSRVRPRQGRYAKFLPAILFYFVYLNLLFFARFLFEGGKTDPVFGLWWVNVLMLFLVLIYYAFSYQWFKRARK